MVYPHRAAVAGRIFFCIFVMSSFSKVQRKIKRDDNSNSMYEQQIEKLTDMPKVTHLSGQLSLDLTFSLVDSLTALGNGQGRVNEGVLFSQDFSVGDSNCSFYLALSIHTTLNKFHSLK